MQGRFWETYALIAQAKKLGHNALTWKIKEIKFAIYEARYLKAKRNRNHG